jgi:hypothetical protein
MPKIFLCYRREDSRWPTQWIYNALVDHFGSESVVWDIDSIPYGVDFREYLNKEVSKCDILLAVMGDKWLEILKQRLDQPNDFVRIEIQAALEREIPVVPILVGEKPVPNEKDLPPELANLSYMQRAEVRAGADLLMHLKRFTSRLDHQLSELKADEERKLKEEQEAKRKAEEERKRKEAEEEAERKADEEQKQKEVEEERRKRETEEAERKAEEGRRRKEAEQAERKAEEERKRKEAEEAKRKAKEKQRRSSIEKTQVKNETRPHTEKLVEHKEIGRQSPPSRINKIGFSVGATFGVIQIIIIANFAEQPRSYLFAMLTLVCWTVIGALMGSRAVRIASPVGFILGGSLLAFNTAFKSPYEWTLFWWFMLGGAIGAAAASLLSRFLWDMLNRSARQANSKKKNEVSH